MDQNQKKQFQRKKLNSHIRNRIQKKFLAPGTTEKYIKYCVTLNEQYKNQQDIVFERHHIVPRFHGGTNAPENLVQLTRSQHILVHLLRYLEFGQKNDFLAYVLRNSSKNVDLTTHGKRMAEYYKQNELYFFNPKFQSEQGKKDGKKGGSAKTEIQQQARSKVGKTWGPIVGMSNQSIDLKKALSNFMIFYHEKENVEVIIPPCRSAAELFNFLQNEVREIGKEYLFPDELVKKAKGGGPMYGLIHGKKKKIYGWSIVERISPPQIDD